MSKITFHFMLQAQVAAIRRGLQEWMEPLLEIVEEVRILGRPNHIWLVAEDGLRIQFDKTYFDILKRTFKNAEWYLTQPTKVNPEQKLLVGVMPHNHFILLAPRTEVKHND